MTYESQVSTTWEQALKDWADKIGGMANWSINDDQRASGQIAIEAPETGYGNRVTSEGFVLQSNQLGDGSLASNDLGMYHYFDYTDSTTYEHDDRTRYSMNGIGAADDVEYWLQYSDGWGWAWYVRREMGDGNNWSFFFGAYEWEDNGGTVYYDPTTQDEWKVDDWYILSLMVGEANGGGSLTRHETWCSNPPEPDFNHRWGNTTDMEARGMLHPDQNFTDYIWWVRGFVADETAQNSDTGESPENTRITDSLWLADYSGTSVNTGDVVQDAGGADEWEIVDYHGNRVALRMI